MRSTTPIVRALVVGLVMLFSSAFPPAHASSPPCLQPDSHGPLLYYFDFGLPQTVGVVGTYVEITADDVPIYSNEPTRQFANWVDRVDVIVDGVASTRLSPEAGHHRKPRQRFFGVISATDLGAGVHTLRFQATDACGFTDFRDYDVIVLAPGVLLTCEYPLESLCV